MATIRIPTEQALAVASTFKQKSQESQQMISQLESQVNAMQGEWEGMASQKFFNEYTSWRTSMNKFTEVLNGIADQLETIVKNFKGVDGQG